MVPRNRKSNVFIASYRLTFDGYVIDFDSGLLDENNWILGK